MTQPISFRDAELISAYLDGELPQAEKARLELRFKSDLQLRDLLDELSQARVLLRKLPARRVPRNFMLTPKMAGLKPPLQRAFPVFRLVSALATFLFFFVFAANLSVPALLVMRASAPAPVLGIGGGGGGGAAPSAMEAAAPAAEPQLDAAANLTSTPELRVMAVAPTQGLDVPSASGAPLAPNLPADPGALAKISPVIPVPDQSVPASIPIQLPVSAGLQFGLLALAVLSGGAAYVMQARYEQGWYRSKAIKPVNPGVGRIVVLMLVLLAVAALAISILFISRAKFYAPVPFSPGAGDKGSLTGGDKGGGSPFGAQGFSLTPGLGFNFSAINEAGLTTGFDFPADVFPGEMMVSYIPGLPGTPPDGLYFPNQAFSLIPADKNVEPQTAFSITLEYGDAPADTIALYWWSGSQWQDAAETCNPASSYERTPDARRFSLVVCKMGSFVPVVP